RVAAAVVEEVADVVRPEDLDEALVLGAILLEALQLVPGGAESAAGRMPQPRDRPRALGARVDHVLGQRPDDPVAAGVHLADPVAVPAGRRQHAACAGVAAGRAAAGLCIKRVLFHFSSARERLGSAWPDRIAKGWPGSDAEPPGVGLHSLPPGRAPRLLL